VKVIKPGQKPRESSCTWTCNNCKSGIKSKAFEGKRTYDCRDGDTIVFDCPVCGMKKSVCLSSFDMDLKRWGWRSVEINRDLP